MPFFPQTRVNDAVLPDELPRLSQVGGGAAGNTFARVVKKVDQIVSNSVTLVDDDELFVPLSIDKIYAFIILIYGDWFSASDIKMAFSVPTNASGDKQAGLWQANNDSNFEDLTLTEQFAVATGTRTNCIYGRVIMGDTAGNLQFQWAQNVAIVEDTTIMQGTVLVVWEETA